MENKTVKFVVELSNNSMPFADDARFDVESVVKNFYFDTKAEAKKFFKSKVKELGLFMGGGSNLAGNGQYELFLTSKCI